MLLLLGFPVALILSWAYELTPQGTKQTKVVPASGSIPHVTGRKLDFVIVAFLVLTVGFMFVDNYLLDDSDIEAAVQETTTSTVEPEAESPSPHWWRYCACSARCIHVSRTESGFSDMLSIS